MILLEKPYLKIQFDDSLKAITEEWKLDFTTVIANQTFHEPLEILLEEFKSRKLSRWLCDNTEQKTIETADQNWLETVFYPEMVKNGLKTVALVNAKNILGTGSAKNCLQNLGNLNIEIFNKNIEARKWLQSVE